MVMAGEVTYILDTQQYVYNNKVVIVQVVVE